MNTLQQKEKNMANAASSLADSAKDAANKTSEAVKDAASTVAHKTADAGSYIAHKADDATTAVGGEMQSLAGSIRTKGPHEGMLGNATSAVANTLDTCGRELKEHGLGGIADDITNTIRKHPVPAILCGIGLGFLLARVMAK